MSGNGFMFAGIWCDVQTANALPAIAFLNALSSRKMSHQIYSATSNRLLRKRIDGSAIENIMLFCDDWNFTWGHSHLSTALGGTHSLARLNFIIYIRKYLSIDIGEGAGANRSHSSYDSIEIRHARNKCRKISENWIQIKYSRYIELLCVRAVRVQITIIKI